MDRTLAKPFIEIGGRTILEHTLRRFLGLSDLVQVVVATSEFYIKQAEGILGGIAGERDDLDLLCVRGGDERQHSIYNALEVVGDVELVAIHDAVRPFTTEEVIRRCCTRAAESGAAVAGVPAKDTIKRINERHEIRETPDRSMLWQAQTPQVFRKELIKRAYHRAMEEGYLGTDDSSLVERIGEPVTMVEGERTNFKITYPVDLTLARLLIESEQS